MLDISRMYAKGYSPKPIQSWHEKAPTLGLIVIGAVFASTYGVSYWIIHTLATMIFDLDNRFYSDACQQKVVFYSAFLALLMGAAIMGLFVKRIMK